MTYKENIKAILECSFAGFKEEIIDSACNRILEQEPCEDTISRQSAIFLASDLKQDLPDDERIADMVMAHNEGVSEYQTQLSLLPPVNPQKCDKCEVGNPCLYCRHKFEPQVKKRGVASHTDEIKKRNTRTAEQEETELGSKE